MVSKSTGKTVEMASSDYAMEGGILISRASLATENGTASSAGLDPAVRRRLLQDDEVSVDDDSSANGPYASPIVTASLTDASGALMAGDGSDATCARMTYFEDPSEFPEGWMSLFDMPETALSAIEGLSLEARSTTYSMIVHSPCDPMSHWRAETLKPKNPKGASLSPPSPSVWRTGRGRQHPQPQIRQRRHGKAVPGRNGPRL